MKERHLSPSPGQIPLCPAVLATPLRAMPLVPLALALTAFSRGIARRHPGLFRRLGDYGHTRFVLDPTDLPFVIELEPNGGLPRVRLSRDQGRGAARIAGPLAALLGLVHGAFDGDALFFSRDLVIEGDTSAALALRNAIDDSELDMSQEIARYCGPMKGPLQGLFARIERYSGVSLTRAEEGVAW